MPEELVQQGTSLRIQHELSLACHYADASNAFQKADTNMLPHCRRLPTISSKRSICQWTIQTAICQQCCTACCGLRCTIHQLHSWVIQVRMAMLYYRLDQHLSEGHAFCTAVHVYPLHRHADICLGDPICVAYWHVHHRARMTPCKNHDINNLIHKQRPHKE